MSYKKSRARVSFEASASALLRLSRFASLKKNKFSYDHQNLIFQSAVFRVCAAIEEYLKNFSEDLLFSYTSQNAKLSDIPSNLRASTLLQRQHETFKSYILSGDEIATIKRLQPAANTYRVCFNDEILAKQITINDILGTKKYPSLKNLKIIYNRLGINDIMKEAHKRGKKDYTSRHSSFLSIREAISHQLAPSLTYPDVNRHFKNIVELIDQIDRISFSHISKISTSKFWPS